jgi:hypothetical protein
LEHECIAGLDVWADGSAQRAAGVYYRIELPPGRHRFAGYAFDQGNITVDTQADKVYFVEQHVQGMYNRAQVMYSSEFLTISDARARELIANIHTMPGHEAAGSVTVRSSRSNETPGLI